MKLVLVLFLFSCNKNSIDWSDIAVENITTSDIDNNIMLYFYADW